LSPSVKAMATTIRMARTVICFLVMLGRVK
jgi:hypothetical protein